MKKEENEEKKTTAETLASDEALGPLIEGPSNIVSHSMAERFMGLMLKIPKDNVLLGALSNAYMMGRPYNHSVEEFWSDPITWGALGTWCYGTKFDEIHTMSINGVIEAAAKDDEHQLTKLRDWFSDMVSDFYTFYEGVEDPTMTSEVEGLDDLVEGVRLDLDLHGFDALVIFEDILNVIQIFTNELLGYMPDTLSGRRLVRQYVEGIHVNTEFIDVQYGHVKKVLGPIRLDSDITDCIDDMTFDGSSLIPLEVQAYLKYYAELPVPMAPLVKIMHSGAYEWIRRRVSDQTSTPLTSAMAKLFASDRDEEFFSYNASKAYDMLKIPTRSLHDTTLFKHEEQDPSFTALYGQLVERYGYRPASDSAKDINAAIFDMVSEAEFAHEYRSFVRKLISMYVDEFDDMPGNSMVYMLSPHHSLDPSIHSYVRNMWDKHTVKNPKEFYEWYLKSLNIDRDDDLCYSVTSTLDALFMLPRVMWDPLGLIDPREIVTLCWTEVGSTLHEDAALCLLQSYQYYHYYRHRDWSLLERILRREGHLHCSFLWTQKRVKIDYTFDRAIAVARLLNVKDVQLILNRQPVPLGKTIEGSEWSNLFDGSYTHPLVHDDSAKAVFEGDDYQIVKSFIPVRAILCTTLTKTNDRGRKEKYSVPICLNDILATTIPRDADELMRIVHSYNSLRVVEQQMIRCSTRSIGDVARASMLVGRGAKSLMSNTMLSLNNHLLERKALASFNNNFWPVLAISGTYVRIYANLYRHFASAWDDRSVLDHVVFDQLTGYSDLLNRVRSLPDVVDKSSYLSLVRTIMYDWACGTDMGVYITGRLPKNAVNTYALVKEAI